MLVISREVVVKIKKHGWNVYPLEAFGFLMGNADRTCIDACLPVSKSQRWYVNDQRWTRLEEKLQVAQNFAFQYEKSIVGVYIASDVLMNAEPAINAWMRENGLCLLHYNLQCCDQCSLIRTIIGADGQRIDCWDIAQGIRLNNEFNQKRVLQNWFKTIGHLDYSNGYLENINKN